MVDSFALRSSLLVHRAGGVQLTLPKATCRPSALRTPQPYRLGAPMAFVSVLGRLGLLTPCETLALPYPTDTLSLPPTTLSQSRVLRSRHRQRASQHSDDHEACIPVLGLGMVDLLIINRLEAELDRPALKGKGGINAWRGVE